MTRHSVQTDMLGLVTDTHRTDDGQPTFEDALMGRAPDIGDCTCLHTCDEDGDGCSLSGDWHVHPNRWPGDVMGPCPLHPEAPGDH